MNQFRSHINDIISFMIIINFQLLSNLSLIDSSKSCAISNSQSLKYISMHYNHYISATIMISQPSTTSESISFLKTRKRSSKKIFSPESSQGYQTTSMASISKRRSVWHLPNSFDLMSLHGRSGISYPHDLISRANISSSTQMTPSYSHFRSQRSIYITKMQIFNSQAICILCLVRVLFILLRAQLKQPDDSLFSFTNGSFNRSFLIGKIKELLFQADIDASNFSGHVMQRNNHFSSSI